MVPISIEEFAKKHVKANNNTDKKSLKESLIAAVERKKAGEPCISCGQPIWAIGSALTGSNMCFTCTTGETDHSEDYEIKDVCY
ncbi:hypothetical protein H1D32_08795 [Anaerobacillus sp. CMMVII]|uniref:hypothetical protein n=1 Tax=Anaerobacillus sp. CMMVII TaxID=2755588 RepID=UPI0021B78260|nr:hypothetical protein [Anaerobacillus sp. CMMVII]MCT8137845.1 hypothetical protein [Anaerobacillus sp. CMMVII]